jgi:aconitase B
MPTTGAVTSNEVSVTQQAQGIFNEKVTELNTVGSLVEEWGGIQLSQNAMQTTAGTLFAQAVGQWVEYLNDIKNTLNWMAEQLGYTAQQLLAGEQQNAEQAQSLPAFLDSSSLTAGPSVSPGPGPQFGPSWSP